MRTYHATPMAPVQAPISDAAFGRLIVQAVTAVLAVALFWALYL